MQAVRNRFIPNYRVVRTSTPVWEFLSSTDPVRTVLEEAQRRALVLRDFLVMLQTFEERMIASVDLLRKAMRSGVASQEDVQEYDMLRTMLYRVELYIYDVIRWTVPASAVSRIPKPRPLPSPTDLKRQALEGRGVQGLGVAPVVWAAIVLAVLAAVAGGLLVYAFTSGNEAAEEAKQAIAVGEIARQEWEGMLRARQAAYEQCLARGEAPEVCVDVARGVVPTPGEAGTVPQLLVPESSEAVWRVVVPVTIGAAVLGGLFWFLRRRRNTNPFSGGQEDDFDDEPSRFFADSLQGVRRVKTLDGPSNYYLEIS